MPDEKLTEDEEYWVGHAMNIARLPNSWRWQACQLKRSADLLLVPIRESCDEMIRRQKAFEEKWRCRKTLEEERRSQGLVRSADHPHWLWDLIEEEPPRDWEGLQQGLDKWSNLYAYMMLIGLAFENIAKGIRVAQAPKEVLRDSNRLLNWNHARDGHLNQRLVTQCGLQMTLVESELLDRLGAFVRWGGRYPIPKKPMQMRTVAGDDGMRVGPLQFSSNDPPAIEALWNRLLKLIDEVSAKWHSQDETLQQADRVKRQSDAMRTVLSGAFEQIFVDGVLYFQHRNFNLDREITRIGIGCCGTCVVLTEERPAAICRCRTFFFGRSYYDGHMRRYSLKYESYKGVEWPDGFIQCSSDRSPVGS